MNGNAYNLVNNPLNASHSSIKNNDDINFILTTNQVRKKKTKVITKPPTPEQNFMNESDSNKQSPNIIMSNLKYLPILQ